MARRPDTQRTPPSTDSGSNSPSSSYSSSSCRSRSTTDDWKSTIIFRRDGRTATINIPWHDSALTTQTIADFLDLQLHDIAGTYPLQSIPQDLIDRQAEILLVQLANDRPPASILKFTFVDIEVYRPGDTQPEIYSRRVLWLPTFVNRLSLFRLLHVDRHCHATPERCHLYLNDFEIERRDSATLDIQHGTHVSVYIGDCDPDELMRMLDEQTETEDSWLFQLPTTPACGLKWPPICHLRSDQTTEPPLPHQLCTQAQRPRAPPTQVIPAWRLSLHRTFDQEAFVEVLEEGRVAYVITWLNQHDRHPRCTQPRTVRLGEAVAEWEAPIIDEWEDHFDQRIPSRLLHVYPRPAQATTVHRPS